MDPKNISTTHPSYTITKHASTIITIAMQSSLQPESGACMPRGFYDPAAEEQQRENNVSNSAPTLHQRNRQQALGDIAWATNLGDQFGRHSLGDQFGRPVWATQLGRHGLGDADMQQQRVAMPRPYERALETSTRWAANTTCCC
jgi:hypothetical protein